MARQQLHQAVGALADGRPCSAGAGARRHGIRGAELRRRSLQLHRSGRAEDRARGFALTDFLNALLAGKPVSPVALFPQYRDVLELVGNDRVHPADLWPKAWRWVDVERPPTAAAGLRPGRSLQARPRGAEGRARRRRPRRAAAARTCAWAWRAARPCRASCQLLDGGRRLFRGAGAGPGARRRLCQARRVARAAAVRHAGARRHHRVRPPRRRTCCSSARRPCRDRATRRPRCVRCARLGAWPMSMPSTTQSSSSAASIRRCWPRRASASQRPRKCGRPFRAAT